MEPWQERLWSSGGLSVNGLASHSQGVAAVGFGSGFVDIGGEELWTDGWATLFVAEYDNEGALVWEHGIPAGSSGLFSFNYGYGASVAVDEDRVLVGGQFSGSADFGGESLTAVDTFEAFVAAYDHSGDLLWVEGLGASGLSVVTSVQSTHDGGAYVTGAFEGELAVEGALPSDDTDIFLLRLDGAGQPVWSRTFGGNFRQGGEAVAVARDGGVVVLAEVYGDLDFGGGDVEIPCCMWTHAIARYSVDGEFQWALGLEEGSRGPAGGRPSVVGLDDGSWAVTSRGRGLARVDDGGALLWSRQDLDVSFRGVAQSASGNLVVVVSFEPGKGVVWGERLRSPGAEDSAALIEVDVETGDIVDARSFSAASDGGVQDITAGPLAMTAAERAYVAYGFYGSADFGLGPVEGEDVLVASPAFD